MGAIQVPHRNNHEKLAPLTPAPSLHGGERGRLRNFYEPPQGIAEELFWAAGPVDHSRAFFIEKGQKMLKDYP